MGFPALPSFISQANAISSSVDIPADVGLGAAPDFDKFSKTFTVSASFEL